MSTRANVVIKDGYNTKLFFYRHSDGYPDCTGKDLKDFVKLYSIGKLRDNACQSSGHLILRGHKEYMDQGLLDNHYGWKVGAYEPTNSFHCDVDYLYVIDLKNKVLSIRETNRDYWNKPLIKNTKLLETVKF